MKVHHLIPVLLLGFAFGSCNKEKTEEETFRENLPGNYDWASSSVSATNGESTEPLVTYTPDINGNHYGIRIRKNGKAFLYENGKLTKKGNVKNISSGSYGQYSYGYTTYFVVTLDFGDQTLEFSNRYGFTNDTWPYPNCRNYFANVPKK